MGPRDPRPRYFTAGSEKRLRPLSRRARRRSLSAFHRRRLPGTSKLVQEYGRALLWRVLARSASLGSIGFMADTADRTGSRETLWPFETCVAILSVPILLVMLLITAAVLRRAATWPSPQWDGWALLAIVFISVSPLILLILDRLATTGGSIKVPGGFEVAFAAVTTAATSGTSTTISGNLGSPPGAAIVDSAGTSIFVALREAANNPIAVVDLVDGHAWWETRLLVLLSGASRLNRPRVIVFLATQATQPRRFLGWAPSSDLLHAQLAWASHEELAAFQSAQASAGQYALGIVGQNQVSQLPWPSPLSQPSPPAPDPPISRYE